MKFYEFAAYLVQLDECAARIELQAHPELHSDALAAKLKELAMQVRSSNLEKTSSLIQLIYSLSDLTGSERQRAYAWWVDAVVKNVNQGQYQEALLLYDNAIKVFQRDDDEISIALMQISKLWAQSRLGQNKEALSTGREAERVLRQHEMWHPLATLMMNTANIFSRLGEAGEALTRYQETQFIYESIDEKDRDLLENLGLVIFNQGICHSELGHFNEAISAFEKAISIQNELDNNFYVAQIRQYWGVTCLGLGRYTEALQRLNLALDVFRQYSSERHSARALLYIAKCFLEMKQFSKALENAIQARQIFEQITSPYEEGESNLIIAAACAGQMRFEEALHALRSARLLFDNEDGEVWRAFADLESSFILYELKRYTESEHLIRGCISVFENRGLVIKEAEGHLALGDVLMMSAAVDFKRGRGTEAQQKLQAAKGDISKSINIGESNEVVWLLYRGYYLLGNLFKQINQPKQMEAAYIMAVDALEQLRSYLMIEYRSHFQSGKQILYEELVDFYLDDEPLRGHEYAERAKSRALLDMLSLKLDLRIKPINNEDQPLIEELDRLRIKRNILYRNSQLPEENFGMAERSGKIHLNAEKRQLEIAQLEKRIAGLWHELLSNRAEQYAHHASLAQVRTEPVQLSLAEDVLLVEYFSVHGQIVVFLVDQQKVVARRLATTLEEVSTLNSRFRRNCARVRKDPERIGLLTIKAQKILNQCYKRLLAPIADVLQKFRHIIFVPHGVIHYLPLHALHNGQQYLIEQYEISYLPSASILKYCQDTNNSSGGTLSVGYSAHDLEFAPVEAKEVARLCEGDVILETQATLEHIRQFARNYRWIHLATHAISNAAEPLFSGLQLADGWLSTLDVFDLELNADLVTLSACNTGHHKIESGDELLGLMRAFIYAGAASLLLTHWAVIDHSTSILMNHFYQYLTDGQSKGMALRNAQLHFIHYRAESAVSDGRHYRHPHFWAPFFLVGEAENRL